MQCVLTAGTQVLEQFHEEGGCHDDYASAQLTASSKRCGIFVIGDTSKSSSDTLSLSPDTCTQMANGPGRCSVEHRFPWPLVCALVQSPSISTGMSNGSTTDASHQVQPKDRGADASTNQAGACASLPGTLSLNPDGQLHFWDGLDPVSLPLQQTNLSTKAPRGVCASQFLPFLSSYGVLHDAQMGAQLTRVVSCVLLHPRLFETLRFLSFPTELTLNKAATQLKLADPCFRFPCQCWWTLN